MKWATTGSSSSGSDTGTGTDAGKPVKAAANTVANNWNKIADAITTALPFVFFAILVIAVGYVVVRYTRRYLSKFLETRYNSAFARVTSKIVGWGLMLVVMLIAFAVAFPSINMGSVLASLGFVSVAIGFALKEILENSFAGWLLMYRETFKIGDQIEVIDVFGDVEQVNMRETVIRQRDGQKVIIPNRDVYRNNIRIQTANPSKRFAFRLEFDYNADLRHIIEVLVAAIGEVDGVLPTPAPSGRIDDTKSDHVDVKLMGWAKSDQSDFNACRNRAIQHVIDTMIQHGFPLPDSVVPVDIEHVPNASKSKSTAGRKSKRDNGDDSETA